MVQAKVAVIGAGVAGLSCARELHAHAEVHVFEKSRGIGGRASTRRAGEYRFDHGAQYVTARDDRFRAELDRWVDAGVVAVWKPRLARIGSEAPIPDSVRYVGTPGMSALSGELARGLKVTFDVRVARLLWDDGGWRLRSEADQDLGWFDRVVLAIPAPQAAPLLEGVPAYQRRVEAIEFASCIAAMVVPQNPVEVPWDAAWVDGEILAWVARNDSKPRRPGVQSWVLHASAEYSAARPPESDAATITNEMIDALSRVVGASVRAKQIETHHWRFARPKQALSDDEFLYDGELGLGVCGDWFRGDRLEDAHLSGRGLGHAIVEWHRAP